MMAVNGGLLVHQARSCIVHVHEDGARTIARSIKKPAQIRCIVAGLNHGVIDHRAWDINPAHDIRIDLRQGVEVHAGHIIAAIALDGILLKLLIA